jgi:hypothetical protein
MPRQCCPGDRPDHARDTDLPRLLGVRRTVSGRGILSYSIFGHRRNLTA